MGSLNLTTNHDRDDFQDSYSYKPVLNYSYPRQSSFREIDFAGSNGAGVLLLINPAYYFLECVYILYKKGYYRFVVLQNSRVLTYKNYRTLRGAKIAFQKIYKNKAWKDGVKANWTSPAPGNCEIAADQETTALNQPLKAYSI